MGKENVNDMDALIDLFPALPRPRVRKTPGEKIKMVSNTIVEEVLQDIGVLDFGDGLTCKANVAIWRTRGEHRPLIGEFAYQFRFQDRDRLSKDALRRTEAFFISRAAVRRRKLHRAEYHQNRNRISAARKSS